MRSHNLLLAGLTGCLLATTASAQSRADTLAVLSAIDSLQLYGRVRPDTVGRLVPLILDASLEPWRPLIAGRLGLLCMQGAADSSSGIVSVGVGLSLGPDDATVSVTTQVDFPPGSTGYGWSSRLHRAKAHEWQSVGLGGVISDGEVLLPAVPRPAFLACRRPPAN